MNHPVNKEGGGLFWIKRISILTFLYCLSNLFVDFYDIIHYYILILCLLQKTTFL